MFRKRKFQGRQANGDKDASEVNSVLLFERNMRTWFLYQSLKDETPTGRSDQVLDC